MIIHKSQEIQMLESSPGEATVRFTVHVLFNRGTEAARSHPGMGWQENLCEPP